MTDFVGDNDHGDTLPPAEVLFKEVLEFRKQRDEARRLYCNTMSNVTATYVVHLRKTPEQIAKDMGWGFFKENTNDITK